MFEKLRMEQPEAMSKIIPVEGDISLPNLGVSGLDLELLLDNVSLVFNSAATIKFSEDLRTAVQLNVKGPQQLLYMIYLSSHETSRCIFSSNINIFNASISTHFHSTNAGFDSRINCLQ